MLSHLPRQTRSHAMRIVAPLLMCAPLVSPAPVAAVPAVSFEFAGTGCGPSNLEGWQFKTTQDLTISAIGAFDYDLDGLEHDIPVGIFDDADCSLVTSAVVPKGTDAPLIDQYRYVAIPPLVLAANKTYRAAAIMSCDDFTPDTATLDGFVLYPGITAVVGKRIGSETMLTCPTDASPFIEFSVNFMVSPPCGNGVLQAGEQCDDANADDDDCCSNTCLPQHAGESCAPDDSACTLDRCNASGVCEHPPGNAGSICRPPDFDCDAAETCDGESPYCPEDDVLPDESPCTDDGLFCTGAESCFEGACQSAGDPCEGATCDENANQCAPFTPTATTVPSPSATPTVSATRTATATVTPTRTLSSSPTASPTPSASGTGTPAATATVTATPLATATRTGTSAATATITSLPTVTGTRTTTSAATATVPATPTSTGTHSATTVPSAMQSATATPPPTASVTSEPIETPLATGTSAPTTATATASPISTAAPTDTATAVPTSSECRGDCDGDGTTAINELITAVTIALGSQPLSACPSLDSSGNGAVEINELIAAVANALNGCG